MFPGLTMRIQGQQVRGSGQNWHRLQPVVECGDDVMTLTVRRRRAVQLQLDRGDAAASHTYKSSNFMSEWHCCTWLIFRVGIHKGFLIRISDRDANANTVTVNYHIFLIRVKLRFLFWSLFVSQ